MKLNTQEEAMVPGLGYTMKPNYYQGRVPQGFATEWITKVAIWDPKEKDLPPTRILLSRLQPVYQSGRLTGQTVGLNWFAPVYVPATENDVDEMYYTDEDLKLVDMVVLGVQLVQICREMTPEEAEQLTLGASSADVTGLMADLQFAGSNNEALDPALEGEDLWEEEPVNFQVSVNA